VLTYLLGPLLALLPRRWRKLLPLGSAVEWRKATVLSGIGESLVALMALTYWYSYSMTTWVSNALDAALNGKGPGVTDQEIGFAAYVIWATHPLTWLIAYAGAEGSVRLVGAAFTETNLGTLPLFVMDKLMGVIPGRSKKEASAKGYGLQDNLCSYAGAVREKVMAKGAADVPDELCFTGSTPDEILEIRACRRKAEWDPPRTVRYQDTYYRLEACSGGSALRPFCYTLRKLSAGVMGRTVLVYSPKEIPILAKS
jgi:hypothetical protein